LISIRSCEISSSVGYNNCVIIIATWQVLKREIARSWSPTASGVDAQAAANAQGVVVRQLQADKAPKAEIDAAVARLTTLKAAAAGVRV
jgi:hypothetical protein